VVACVTGLAPGVALGDPGFDANRYLAPPLADDGLDIQRPTTLKGGTWGGVVALSHASDALTGRLEDGGEREIIEEQLWLWAFAAYGVVDRLTLHVGLPIPIRQVGDTNGVQGVTSKLHSFAVGDLRLGGRVGLTGPPREVAPFGLALDAALFIPIGSREAFASDGKVRVQVTAIAESIVEHHFFVGGTVGVLTRPELHEAGTTTGTMLQLAAAGGLRSHHDALRLGAEANAQIPLAHAGASYEILGVAKTSLFGGLHLTVGAGPGIGSGWQTPDLRAVARVGWQQPPRR